MAILELVDVRKVYKKGDNEVVALRDIDLVIEKGEFLAIMGPSGSGKTTLLNIVGCLDVPSSGRVNYDGRELGGLKQKQLSLYRRDNIAFIFQSYNLIPVLTVRENVELPLIIERKYGRAEIAERAMDILKLVGLEDKARRLPKELSGGQEQRVAIARALIKDPLVVLADEPTANLDSRTAEEIIDIMKSLNERKNTTFIFSTHDKLVESHARRVVVIRDGVVHSDERRA
jgi:putative ABC transport system ATP-binding protein